MNELAFTDGEDVSPASPVGRGEVDASSPASTLPTFDDPCPRCKGVLEAGLYGPCTACREALRVWAAKPRKKGRKRG